MAQPVTHLDGVNNEDQPWLLVGPQPGVRFRENVYVAYDDFNTAPDMHVAVAAATDPLMFTVTISADLVPDLLTPAIGWPSISAPAPCTVFFSVA